MGLTSFSVQNNKSIKLAALDQVPPITIIAGPNGAGKSTLLYAIKNGSNVITPGTRLLYQGPHRVLRRTNVNRSWLGGQIRKFQELLESGGDVSGYDGLNFQNSSRTPDNVDEAGSTIKHTMGKIENRRQAVISQLVDKKSANRESLNTVDLPDVYEPLKTLTKYLLPHLEFKNVDFTNEANIKCAWTRKDGVSESALDIDDLSSGEKSIIILFLPLLEEQILSRLDKLTQLASGEAIDLIAQHDRVVLIDEPEQHLHPDLQAKILDYIREQVRGGGVQFVLTTHSPTE